MSMTHLSVEPAILYLGTPVVLVSSLNENGSPNLAPMSSAFWLGWRCMLGFEAVSKTPNNIIRTVGRIAQEAGVKTLVLSHLIPAFDGISDDTWRAAAAKNFKGEIIVGKDLMIV